MMLQSPETLHAALNHFADAVGQYACHQVECGAQVVQFFESWAHPLGPTQFETYAKPYADRAMRYVKERHPDVPVVYYANGGSSYLAEQKDMACDMISLDWACDMAQARQTLGQERLVQGNIDPTVLPTPAAYALWGWALTRQYRADAGVVVAATTLPDPLDE